jgi:hypothetical protein
MLTFRALTALPATTAPYRLHLSVAALGDSGDSSTTSLASGDSRDSSKTSLASGDSRDSSMTTPAPRDGDDGHDGHLSLLDRNESPATCPA